jgi:hypothetical protein
MASGFTITCLAHSFSDESGTTYRKGWSAKIANSDPIYQRLKGNRAFTFEPCDVPDPGPVTAKEKPEKLVK